MRAMDWTRTPLGPPEYWPISLKTAVGIMMSSRYAMFVWWGRHLSNLYNDAYRPLLGKKHPNALGQHSGDCDRPFQLKVITHSGDRDQAVTRPIGSP